MRNYWRKKAIEYVNYKCQICKKKKADENLILHHKNPFKVIVICKDCHSQIHTRDLTKTGQLKTVKRVRCPKCKKLGIPRMKLHIRKKKYRDYYLNMEHPEENRWCYLGKRYDTKKYIL